MEINKPVATVIIFIIILMLIFLFVIPTWQQSSDLQNIVTQKEAEYSGKSMYYANISELLTNIQSKSDAMQKIDSALPSHFSFAPIAYFLQKNAAEKGLTITSITFSGISPATSHQEVRDITFMVNLQGSYQSLKNFLYSLDTSVRLFEVNTISLSLPATLAGNPSHAILLKNQLQTYNFQLEIKTHTY